MSDAITITIENDAISAMFAALRSKVDNVDEALNVIGEFMRTEADLGFKDGIDPYGLPWLPLKRNRRLNKAAGKGSKPLQDTGALRSSISFALEGAGVTVGLAETYAIFHQFGTRFLPVRSMLPSENQGLPTHWQESILDVMRQFLLPDGASA